MGTAESHWFRDLTILPWGLRYCHFPAASDSVDKSSSSNFFPNMHLSRTSGSLRF